MWRGGESRVPVYPGDINVCVRARASSTYIHMCVYVCQCVRTGHTVGDGGCGVTNVGCTIGLVGG